MGHKVNPISFRIGGIQGWKSKWFSEGLKYRKNLIEDYQLRKYIQEKLKAAAVAAVEIERSPGKMTFNIFSSRPGVIIGRGGAGIEDLKRELLKIIQAKGKTNLDVNIQEVRQPESNAQLVGLMVAEQLEKRIPFRRVVKQTVDRAMQTQGVEGVKIMVAGRLDGSEMSRREWVAEGSVPLHTLRADIDFAKVNAWTKYGILGIKVWIYRGEVFEDDAQGRGEKKEGLTVQPQPRPGSRLNRSTEK